MKNEAWKKITNGVNAVSGGPVRTVEKIQKKWTDWKSKTKVKALKINKELKKSGKNDELYEFLSNQEKKIMEIVGPVAFKGEDEGMYTFSIASASSTRDARNVSYQLTDEIGLPFPPAAVSVVANSNTETRCTFMALLKDAHEITSPSWPVEQAGDEIPVREQIAEIDTSLAKTKRDLHAEDTYLTQDETTIHSAPMKRKASQMEGDLMRQDETTPRETTMHSAPMKKKAKPLNTNVNDEILQIERQKLEALQSQTKAMQGIEKILQSIDHRLKTVQEHFEQSSRK